MLSDNPFVHWYTSIYPLMIHGYIYGQEKRNDKQL